MTKPATPPVAEPLKKTKKAAAPAVECSEAAAAVALGVARARVRALRMSLLRADTHYRHDVREGIVLTVDGMGLLRRVLAPEAPPPKTEARLEPLPTIAEQRVLEVPVNRKLLVCCLATLPAEKIGPDDRYLVRVADNEMFVRGMRIPADRLVTLGPRVWQVRGRLPRRKGQW